MALSDVQLVLTTQKAEPQLAAAITGRSAQAAASTNFLFFMNAIPILARRRAAADHNAICLGKSYRLVAACKYDLNQNLRYPSKKASIPRRVPNPAQHSMPDPENFDPDHVSRAHKNSKMRSTPGKDQSIVKRQGE